MEALSNEGDDDEDVEAVWMIAEAAAQDEDPDRTRFALSESSGGGGNGAPALAENGAERTPDEFLRVAAIARASGASVICLAMPLRVACIVCSAQNDHATTPSFVELARLVIEIQSTGEMAQETLKGAMTIIPQPEANAPVGTLPVSGEVTAEAWLELEQLCQAALLNSYVPTDQQHVLVIAMDPACERWFVDSDCDDPDAFSHSAQVVWALARSIRDGTNAAAGDMLRELRGCPEALERVQDAARAIDEAIM